MTARPRPLSFAIDGGRRFTLSAAMVTRLRTFEQQSEVDPEAGGLLLGRHLSDGAGIVVDLLTEPGPLDKRGRYSFERTPEGHAAHQAAADKAWAESGGTCCILGTWHTHAEPLPEASSIDLAEWRRHSREWDWDGDALYHVIVGTAAICVWEADRAGIVRFLQPYNADMVQAPEGPALRLIEPPPTPDEIARMRRECFSRVMRSLEDL